MRRTLRHITVYGLLGFFLHQAAVSQEVGYAREVIRALCDSAMHGRGPESGGEEKAAAFIAGRFRQLGLKPPGKGYLQSFVNKDVNIYAGSMSVSIDGKALQPGRDFVIDVSTPKVHGSYSLSRFDKALLANGKASKAYSKSGHAKEFIVADREGVSDKAHLQLFDALAQNPLHAGGIIYIEDEKLTYGRERINPVAVPIIHILRSSMPVNARTLSVDIDCRKARRYRSQNVLAIAEGSEEPDSFLVFTAHYDHIGRMGAGTYFPGANDNASGVAMLLSLAKHYAAHPAKCSVAFIAFGSEERMLLGSSYFAEHPLLPLKKIKFLINLDILGTGEDGIRVVNATAFPQKFSLLLDINEKGKLLKQVRKRGEAAISDHYPLYAKGVPCFYIYTLGGISAYHDIYDRPETLPLTEFEDIFKLLTAYINTF